ncbi:MAG: hypothetical protein HY861_02090, partial [Chlamydiia bacterium]|nr:hypothetical protein [Chlamydiia bacterium]
MITFRLGRPGAQILTPRRVLFLLWLFLLVFPKGGFKIGGIPITWGYLLIAITCSIALLRNKLSIRTARLEMLALLLPFQIISTLTFITNGIEDLGMTLSFLL